MDETKIKEDDDTKMVPDDETKISPDDEAKLSSDDETSVKPATESDDILPTDEDEMLASDDTGIPIDEMEGILPDETVDDNATVIDEDVEPDSQEQTIASEGDLDKSKEDTITEDKTSIMFGISDIQQKLQAEMDEIPEDYGEHIEPEQMSILIKDHFPGRSKAEKIRINRNFLKDAEPFKLENLAENIKKTPEGLPTGFKSLDASITIPPDALTLIASQSKHGKTCFMLNMLLNMCRLLPGKRFVFYTYEEPKWDIFMRLINMSGTKQFNQREGLQTNLDHWKYEFKHTDIETLTARANEDIEYMGLKNFLEISGRIHVIDSNHKCLDLIDSIYSFGKAFDVGAVFIDSLPKIHPEDEKRALDRRLQLQEISHHLRKAANETRFPLIVGSPLAAGAKGTPEYDNLQEENLMECGSPEQNAELIIGLQNYARSRFIGSNLNDNFKSNFFGQPLQKAQPMPENLKDMMQKTILLAKIIANKSGPEPETELIFHKQLLKITDFQDEPLGP